MKVYLLMQFYYVPDDNWFYDYTGRVFATREAAAPALKAVNDDTPEWFSDRQEWDDELKGRDFACLDEVEVEA